MATRRLSAAACGIMPGDFAQSTAAWIIDAARDAHLALCVSAECEACRRLERFLFAWPDMFAFDERAWVS
jgi:hypothetical protein